MGLVQKAFSDIITFSRSSNATRVGPTGVLEYAPHNLLTYSEDISNAAWTKSALTITANSIAAPNGTVTADLATGDGTNVVHDAFQLITTGVNTITASAYVKLNTASSVYISLNNSASTTDFTAVSFDIANGTLGGVVNSGGFSGGLATITSVGNGWYRISLTATSNAASNYVFIGLSSGLNPSYGSRGRVTITSSDSFYLWGAQLAVGPYALDYTPTTSAAVYGPRFDYNGSGVTIVEPVSRNLLLYSQEFENAAWTKENVTVTTNATTAPDGTVTADTFTENTANLEHFANQQTSKAATNIPYTFSVYVKRATSGTRNVAVAITDGTTGGYEAVFDPDDGAILIASRGIGITTGWTPGAATATNAGNGWWRFTFSVVSNTSTRLDGVVYMVDGTTKTYTGNGSSNLFVWGAQLELGSTATGYMVSGATNGFRAVPVVSGSATPKGLLVEEQRQNLLPASNDFSNVTYWTGGGSVTANATTSPDGTVNAAIGASINPASGVGDATVAISASIFAKANPSGTSSLVLRINRFGSGTDYLQVTFNLSTGVAGAVTNSGTASGGSASMVAFGSGWYRCVLSGTVSTTAGTLSFNPQSTCFIYGAQLEAGSFATSYIPTLASTVTRSADVASVNTLSPWYNQSASTLFVDCDIVGFGPTIITQLVASSATNGLLFYQATSSTEIFAFVNSSPLGLGANQFNVPIKLALAYDGSSNAAVKNGGVVTSLGGTISAAATKLSLGSEFAGGSQMSGHLRRVAYYPRRLTNAELQALTA